MSMRTFITFLFSAASLLAATASPVSISTISRTANVVTVTCALTCGIAANQGFQITGVTDTSFNVNSTASTGSGTTFTFAQTGANASSSGGSVLPAKQIILLSTVQDTNGIRVNGVFWITTTAGIAGSASSAWSGASTAEKNALAAGTTIEVPFSNTYGPTTSKAAIQADLQSQFNARQSAQSALSVQPGSFTGGFFDGTGWSF